MLVNALNTHPDLNVTHVDGGEGGGGSIRGHALTNLHGHKPNVSKAIVLTRNPRDRLLSYRTDLSHNGMTAYHSLEPVTVHRTGAITQGKVDRQGERDRRLLQDSMKYERVLRISYEELTGNHDIRCLPEAYGRKICSFIGVEYRELITKYHKPEVIECA